ncbi:prepilin-type N-terminal cleavage/methylation domain protein [Nautilia profundicola AmH]|uniref:Prepilin-type N-terminal cleavage/methylation domain protein n=1 Tax=Nautilia profundicola (strain ATCC BAA-1463 / DSM 18972 / AmH) TaxID=598659 RepID=B9L9D1_NAUPA|nr:prepilin-type N-terminal cleavage/methylation domain-containing protein [Nautilia profundicola]ACM93205.1 prepilin-type N-terminal cleavage/methylation domain protein [Nautilia profundicola AmH]
MKKSFTLVELIIVVVILGILGTISIEILQNTFQNYIKTKELNKLAFKTDLTLNIIASKLQNRIKNSVIAVECNATLPASNSQSCINSSMKNFITVSNLDPTNSYKYPVLEWLYVPIYAKRGMWDSAKKSIQPGWSGFVDLKLTDVSNNDEYNITSPDSNFTIAKQIEKAWFDSWGVPNSGDVFADKFDVLVFSGSDGRGDFDDINNSYGYYGNTATRVFELNNTSDTKLNIKAINPSNSTTVYEGYYLVRGAMAIVPVYDASSHDYNLTLRFNYFPWNAEMYMEGNSTLLATHVTQFKFKEEGGVVRLYLCITAPQAKLTDFNLTICKEKVVF